MLRLLIAECRNPLIRNIERRQRHELEKLLRQIRLLLDCDVLSKDSGTATDENQVLERPLRRLLCDGNEAISVLKVTNPNSSSLI